MKNIKLSLRFGILTSSILSFLVGWSMFSHAGKPIPFSFFTSPTANPITGNLSDLQTISTYSPVPTMQSVPSLVTGATTNRVANLPASSSNVQLLQISAASSNAQLTTSRIRTKGS